ncbi:F-box protein At3g07870-like [Coffea eugenioides]|uniref:F-box protein At3g07870-like n=1 Tax=Coffea eugenioides TaxID=49369 RepID=UPI000F610C2A|nr:F-box protein At3g07870-like [Coffea eugenioides]
MEIERESKRRKSTSNDEHHHPGPGNCFENLPQEVALDIISRLYIKSVIQFRFVCRSWNKLSHDLDLVNLHLTRALENKDISLIFHCDYPVNNQLYFVEFADQNPDKDVLRKIQTPFSTFMPEFQVVSSCNGLLCLSNSLFHDGPYVYNPFTGDYKVLPKSTEFQDQDVVLGFGFHPNTNEYRVIRIVYYWNLYELPPRMSRRFRYRNFPGSEVQIFCQGSEKWRVIGDIPYKLDQSSGGVFVNGKLHWVSLWGKNHCRRDRILVSFDLSNEIFSEVPLPENDVNLFRHRYSLSVLGGCLSIVHPSSTNYWVQDIWIMKEYGVKESWEKVFSIGAYDVTRYRSPEMRRTYRIWKNVINQRYVRVLCLLSNGEILLQYRWGALVSYNPENGMFKDIKFPGMPKFFHITVHIGSLSRANAASMLMNLN